MFVRLGSALGALLLLLAPAGSSARPYTVGDLLHEQSFGSRLLDPTGRWLAIERRDAYDTGGAYDLDHQIPVGLGRLLLEDLAHPGPARPLLKPDRRGVALGAFSPAGTRLAVYRLRQGHWSLGAVTLATGRVRWFAVTPEQGVFGQTLQWESETSLLVIARPDGTPSFPLRVGRLSAEVLPARWAATASGRRAATVLGSGAYAGVRRRSPPRQLLRVNVATGATTELARGAFTDLELAPDHARAALLAEGEDIALHADRPLQGDWGLETARSRLTLVDLKTRATATPCPACDVLPLLLDWSPSGKSLLVYSRAEDSPWSKGDLQVVDVGSGRVSSAAPSFRAATGGRPVSVKAGWMGETPIALGRTSGDTADVWYRLASGGPERLFPRATPTPQSLLAVGPESLVALVEGAVQRLASDGRMSPVVVGAKPIFEAQAGLQRRLAYRLPPHSWVLIPSASGRALAQVDAEALTTVARIGDTAPVLLAASTAQSAAVFRTQDDHRVEHVAVVTGRGTTVAATVNAALQDIDPPRVLRISHASPEGQPLSSWLFLPPTAEGGRPPPLVVKVYSGDLYRSPPGDLAPPNGLLTNIRTLVGHGYAVLTPSLPWPKARGEPMAGLAERILAVVDRAAADPTSKGTFDPDRLAIWGHSYGGYTTLAAIGQSHRFRAAVSLAGFSDLISQWGAFPGPWGLLPEEGIHTSWTAGWVETSQGDMGAPPWIDPERYLRNSPLFSAGRIETPVLMVHGDQDDLPMGQADQMFSALYRQDKDALLITYWGEGHLISSPGNVADFFRRAFAFLDARLGFTPPADGDRNLGRGLASSGPRIPRSRR